MSVEGKGKLWELRVRVVGDVARGIYATTTDQRVAGLSVVAKMAREKPRMGLETARKRVRPATGYKGRGFEESLHGGRGVAAGTRMGGRKVHAGRGDGPRWHGSEAKPTRARARAAARQDAVGDRATGGGQCQCHPPFVTLRRHAEATGPQLMPGLKRISGRGVRGSRRVDNGAPGGHFRVPVITLATRPRLPQNLGGLCVPVGSYLATGESETTGNGADPGIFVDQIAGLCV